MEVRNEEVRREGIRQKWKKEKEGGNKAEVEVKEKEGGKEGIRQELR